jgi:hypothetical protein
LLAWLTFAIAACVSTDMNFFGISVSLSIAVAQQAQACAPLGYRSEWAEG